MPKKNIDCEFLGQHTQPKRKSVIADQKIRLTGFYTHLKYSETLRLITYYNTETGKELLFLTNNFTLAAQTIANLYEARWQVETFYKWIKQNLKIKTFLGTSYNAVTTQIWTAMIYYLLLSFIKFQTKYSYSMQELARIINEMLRFDYKQCKTLKYKNHQLAFL